ncbi:hypothetical protein ABTX77_32695 [Streptomyces sp. NPDC097704]|uniref:hypothetical protein n=1 Tax=Streptomyces sp. NPDC097704 TaxID=3157101 RepID=UPI00332AE4EC
MRNEYHGGTTWVRRPVPGRAAACELADATAGPDWSVTAADDVLVVIDTVIDTLVAALAQIGPEVREGLAAVTAVSVTARRPRGRSRVVDDRAVTTATSFAAADALASAVPEQGRRWPQAE